MPKLAALVLGFVAVIVAAALGLEVRRWRAGRHFISRRRFIIRLVAGMILIALLGAIAAGLYWFDLQHPEGKAALFLAFWSLCLLAGFALLLLAIADLREVSANLRQSQQQVWKDFARLVADKLKKDDPGTSRPGDDG